LNASESSTVVDLEGSHPLPLFSDKTFQNEISKTPDSTPKIDKILEFPVCPLPLSGIQVPPLI
jgi:hypothetical protein